MALRINTNVFSLSAQRAVSRWQSKLAGSFERLSSGSILRRDDAAGWAIADRMRARSRSLNQALRNVMDGISVVQTAEGSLSETSDLLVRMRELAIQAANGTLSTQDRATIQEEVDALGSEVDRIARSTGFNGIRLLDGSASGVNLQVGAGVSAFDRRSINIEDMRAASLGIDALDVTSQGGAQATLDALDVAIDSVSAARGRLGATQVGLESRANTIRIESENLEASASRITDVDFARETAELTRNQIMLQASLSVLAQANVQPQIALQLIQNSVLGR